jgi:multidrug efflux pump subunit AcrB
MLADLSAELSMNALTDTVEHWLTVSAAASRLGLTPDGVKSRIRRGTLRSRLGNNRRLLVAVPVNASADRFTDMSKDSVADVSADTVNGHTDMLVQLARLEERLAVQASAHARERQVLETVIVDLRGERDRLAAELAEARKGWLERLIEAVRRR